MKEPNSNIILAGAALFAGLCKLIPVPFLGSFLLRHIHRQMITSILALHDIQCKGKDLYPLYRNHRGCFVNILIYMFIFPFVLIVKFFIKILKWLFFILIIREAAIEIGKTILLGHTIERCIMDSRIPIPSEEDPKSYRQTFKATVRCKKKFNRAFKGSDIRFIIHIFKGTAKSLKKFPDLLKVTITIFKKKNDNSDIKNELNNLDSEDRSNITIVTDEIVDILNNRETQAYITEFDKLFDEKWG